MRKLILILMITLTFNCQRNNKVEKLQMGNTQYIRTELVSKGKLIYPDSLKINNIKGTVWVECLIDTNGLILERRIFKTDNEKLNQAALKTIDNYKFKSAVMDNKKINSRIIIPIKFE